ncbi:hypothetical protein B0J13DRAFT_101757 [Dactylonectria estremocensis]|uniref:Secreted protein n=1 Tax=Dactylonectria estremocensis TaxID=1079267 RepID=A0A9P9E9B2_9HYPO|nr:hypothetical protein B0J13DRAFT_101757 [Dactylonectria estremocensis]
MPPLLANRATIFVPVLTISAIAATTPPLLSCHVVCMLISLPAPYSLSSEVALVVSITTCPRPAAARQKSSGTTVTTAFLDSFPTSYYQMPRCSANKDIYLRLYK